MAIRYYWFTATIILTILGGGLFIYRLDKGGLNIDFVGGTAYSGQLEQDGHDRPKLRGRSEETCHDLPDLSVEQSCSSSNPEFSEGNRSKLVHRPHVGEGRTRKVRRASTRLEQGLDGDHC